MFVASRHVACFESSIPIGSTLRSLQSFSLKCLSLSSKKVFHSDFVAAFNYLELTKNQSSSLFICTAVTVQKDVSIDRTKSRHYFAHTAGFDKPNPSKHDMKTSSSLASAFLLDLSFALTSPHCPL